jgi:hypothetical protein
VEDRCRIRFAARSRQHKIGMPSATIGPFGKSGRQTKVLELATLNLAALPLFCLVFLPHLFCSGYHIFLHCNDPPHLACCCIRRLASEHVEECRRPQAISDSRSWNQKDNDSPVRLQPVRNIFQQPLVRLIKPTGNILADLAVQQAAAFIGSCSSASYACRQSSDVKRDQEMCNQKEGNSVLLRTMLCRAQEKSPASNTDEILQAFSLSCT